MAELPQIETFDELPTIGEEIRYDSQENFSEVATEIQIEESFFEATESYDNQRPVEGIQEIAEFFAEEPVTETQSSDFGTGSEIETERFAEANEEPSTRPSEESVVATTERPREEPVERSESDSPRNEETISQEQPEQIDNESETISNEPQTEDTVVASEEITNESTGVAGEDEIDREGETRAGGNGDAGDETNARAEEDIESGNQEVEESRNERVSPRDNQTITVENVEKKVNELVKRIDQRLVATSVIVAKAMQSSFSVDNYGKVNKDILNQPNIDGGDYFETRQYIDVRNLYAENQNVYGDPVAQYQKNVQDKVDERIRAEEHLRRIRGY